MARTSGRILGVAVPAIAILALAGCEGGFEFPGFGASGTEDTGRQNLAAGGGEERDVEAPEVFQTSETGLWDGRPSLGGVWVAHPDVTDPERVIIVNEANGQSVIGALFRRERENPGPRIQVSSDAATELGLLAGQPVPLTVTALRREVVEAPVAAALPEAEPIETAALDDDPLAAAAAAIDEAEGTGPAIQPAASAPVAAAAPSSLERPFIQIGIFSVEANANNTGASLRNAGIVPTILRQESQGKVFWRVIVGPATSAAERAEVLASVKSLGFTDAYFVTN
ncbi:MAG: SPOR domain-containing protein [Paracoccaceae bacterium]|nr:SPOR domain-containing protein [Paracoccaceae bacterium]